MKNPTVFARKALIVPFLLVSPVWAPGSLQGQDSQAYEALYAASNRYYGLETLCARFRQDIELTLLRRSIPSEGTVCMRQPSGFAMHWSDPDGDQLVVDGEFAWTYYPSTDDKQVMRCSVDGPGGGNNFFSNFLDNPRGRFDAVHEGREPMGESVSHKIALTPRETGGAAEFRSVGCSGAGCTRDPG
jgi:outer membrane lipoprotein-sorting protein